MSWQKPARVGAAVVGIASALAVYVTMGERRTAAPPRPVERSDPKAVVEITGSLLERFSGVNKEFEILDASLGKYEDGSVRLKGKAPDTPLQIVIHREDDRTFRVSTHEARVSSDENLFELTGPVRLEDSDGFWLQTNEATINRKDSIAHVPGAATFGKGRMTGSGVGFSYDEIRQVLLIAQNARVKTVDDAGTTTMELASGTAMLDRLQHRLTLDTAVHVLRDDQTIDAEHSNSQLGPDNDVVTYIELHGNSRVTGGAPIDTLSARDIGLAYTADGKTLEAVKMQGNAAAGLAGEGGRSGRRIVAETIELGLASDGTLTRAMARENVRMDLPSDATTPPRTITARALDGAGEPGTGLTALTFTDNVSFIEQPLRSSATAAEKQGSARTAHSQKLEAALTDEAVSAATFTGDVTFEEAGLKACAARAEYQPNTGALALAGATRGGNPMVAEEKVAIEGRTIDVTLETRRMTARGDVRTWMRSPAVTRCRPSTQRAAAKQGADNVPRLLDSDKPVTVVASHLEYNGETGYATYSGGRVSLEQDQTRISGDTLVLDQTKGDLTATGKAVARLHIDNKPTEVQAHEIRYSDETRLIVFAGAPKTAATEALLNSGPGSSLRAGSIDVNLAAQDNTVDRIRALRNVHVVEGNNTVTGGSSLDYRAADQKYVIRGTPAAPVTAITRESGGCRRFVGNLIEIFKGSDRISIDGTATRQVTMAPAKSQCTPSTR